jgi:predicted outer membrane lipoprotein
MDLELDLSVVDLAPPVPKLLREASDITRQESLETQDTVTLRRSRGRFKLLHQQQFRNSLLASVGFLELANASDFAANVWNDIPVPAFAVVLMAIGGTLALGMTAVAVQDFRVSWRNVRLLKDEKEHLQKLRQYHAKNPELARLLDSRLGVGMREIGTEVVDRIFMDTLLGAGSILVGVGTLMAIGGANRRVFKASNLLSGYIGNGLAAAFGLLNAIWSWYLIHRFSKHDAAVRKTQPSDDISRRLHSRFRRFQWHAFINGTNGLVAGAASMVTATRWWGYVVLIPCVVSLIVCNYFRRKKLGYDRPVLGHVSLARMQLTPLLEDLEYVIAMQRGLSGLDISLPQTIVQTGSYESMLQFIVRNRMLDIYTDSLAHDKKTRHILLEIPALEPDQIIVIRDTLLRLSSSQARTQILLDHVKRFLCTDGVRIFTHREQYLLELLGYDIWRDQTAVVQMQETTIEPK